MFDNSTVGRAKKLSETRACAGEGTEKWVDHSEKASSLVLSKRQETFAAADRRLVLKAAEPLLLTSICRYVRSRCRLLQRSDIKAHAGLSAAIGSANFKALRTGPVDSPNEKTWSMPAPDPSKAPLTRYLSQCLSFSSLLSLRICELVK